MLYRIFIRDVCICCNKFETTVLELGQQIDLEKITLVNH